MRFTLAKSSNWDGIHRVFNTRYAWSILGWGFRESVSIINDGSKSISKSFISVDLCMWICVHINFNQALPEMKSAFELYCIICNAFPIRSYPDRLVHFIFETLIEQVITACGQKVRKSKIDNKTDELFKLFHLTSKLLEPFYL